MSLFSRTKPKHPKVVIVGGGFAGIAAIQTLKKSGVRCDITLVTKNDRFQYYPALYKLVTGALAIEVSVPYKEIKKMEEVVFIQDSFEALDAERQVVKLSRGGEVAYDYLVLALGSETNYFGIPGLAELSLSFKSVKEALRLKRHFCALFSSVKELPAKEAAAKLHTIIVGGGPSGVELAGDLTHYLRGLAKDLEVDPSLVTIDLIESAPRILASLPEAVSKKAEKRLRGLGVNIYTNRAVTEQNIAEVSMGGMNVASTTVIWTAGTRINSAYQTIPGVQMTERKRVLVDEYLALPKDNHIFVAGDGAGTPYSGLAQTADYDGKYIGEHIARMIRGKKPVPYRPKGVSFAIPVGNYWALFSHKNLLIGGLLPWILRSVIDFRYFLSLVPLWYVIDVFCEGYKYRVSRTYCPIE